MSYSKILKSILSTAHPKLMNISEEVFFKKLDQNKWSKIEILGHLVDSGKMNYSRFEASLKQDNLVFDGYDQDAQVVAHNYQNSEITKTIDEWVQVNNKLEALVENISMTKLNLKTGQHNFHKICMNRIDCGSETSLNYLVWDYIYHLEHHLAQLIVGYHKQIGPYRQA